MHAATANHRLRRVAVLVSVAAMPLAAMSAAHAATVLGTPAAAARPAAQAPVEVSLGAPNDARWVALGQGVHYTNLAAEQQQQPVGIAPVGGGNPVVCPGNVCTPTTTGNYVVTGNPGTTGTHFQTLLSVGSPDDCTAEGSRGSCVRTFGSAGEHTFVVPQGTTSLHLQVIGGDGGSHPGSGRGGHAATISEDLTVTPGQTLYLVVGGVGHTGQGKNEAPGPAYNGGGAGGNLGASGGGASDVRTRPVSEPLSATSDSRILVAAGGGGAGGVYGVDQAVDGGDAGSAGGDAGSYGPGGTPGTATDPGSPDGDGPCYGCGGTYPAAFPGGQYTEAGGGGGLHGGGSTPESSGGGGGGGGSSLVPSGATLGINTGSAAPLIRVSYTQGLQLTDDLAGRSARAGGTVHFRVATAPDAPAVPGYTLTIDPAADASCTGSTCTATRPGTYTVTASKGADQLTDVFQVVPGRTVALQLTPRRALILFGTSRTYRLARVDRYGNATAVPPPPNGTNLLLTTDYLPTGYDCDGDTCTPPFVGTWTVTASNSGLRTTATLQASWRA